MDGGGGGGAPARQGGGGEPGMGRWSLFAPFPFCTEHAREGRDGRLVGAIARSAQPRVGANGRGGARGESGGHVFATTPPPHRIGLLTAYSIRRRVAHGGGRTAAPTPPRGLSDVARRRQDGSC